MLDDIGLGKAIANTIYLIIGAVGILVAWILLKKKFILGVAFWISSILNFLAYLFFMGNYRLYPNFFYPIINKYWPWINLALLIFLIINYVKNKNANKNN